MSYEVGQLMPNKVIGHVSNVSDDFVRHMSNDFVRQVSYKSA